MRVPNHLHSEQEGSVGAAVQRLPGGGLGGELHDALPRGAAAVVHDDDGALHLAEDGEGLLQQLVGDVLRQVAHGQGRALGGEAHAQLAPVEGRVVQLRPGDLGQGPRLL